MEQVNSKIQLSSAESDNNKVSDIKKSIKNLEQEIRQMEQKEGILEWQLRTAMISQQRGIYGQRRRKSSVAYDDGEF